VTAVAAKKKAAAAKAPSKRPRRVKAEAKSAGIGPAESPLAPSSPEVAKIAQTIESDGGAVVGAYRDPLGGHPLVLAVLPIDTIEPTPFQRDLSEAHHKRLADVIQKTGRFLDPVVAVTSGSGSGFWTPNGRHRLEAMRRLGAKSITALVVPSREIAWQILALNTEKAHNLKERALEVVRIYRGLVAEDASRVESGFAFYLEDPALVVAGAAYEKNPRFAGGAYHPALRRTLTFLEQPIGEALAAREATAKLLLELDAAVGKVIEQLKAKGLVSPYLRAFVVARINPLRFIKGDPPPADELLVTMRQRAERFNVGKVEQRDLATAAGPPDEEG
jgi:ParB family chromosome partitioning protein